VSLTAKVLGNASQERCPAGCSTGRRHRADEASDNSRADEQRSGNAEQVGPSGELDSLGDALNAGFSVQLT
jgi:hypothetical protein